MDQQQLAKEIQSGNVNFVQPPLPQPQAIPPDDSMRQFVGLLTAIREPRGYVTVAPTQKPKTSHEEIQYLDDGVTQKVFFYINNNWRSITVS